MLVQVIIAIAWLVLTVLRDSSLPAPTSHGLLMALIYDMDCSWHTAGAGPLHAVLASLRSEAERGLHLVTAFPPCSGGLETTVPLRHAELRQGDAWATPPWPSRWWPAAGSSSSSMPSRDPLHHSAAPQENTPNYFDTVAAEMR
ncbi:G-protein coupled receptor family C group 5 member B [Camelus dromedarius]|uniref:G-protein coupled receptor family C group 5 member B n=1 Tax=Camelus dromedarius TaxID=9838 RepID=A0A5N4CYA7_CAMDR|nr:G-protein coupled receptor family C group 5 member B [Camelus dromedarius]